MASKQEIVFIALGTNLGRKKNNINKAIELITSDKRNNLIKKSAFIKTKPKGYKNQPHFINSVISLETTLKPKDLLVFLKDIEFKLGRFKTFCNGPRVIDLDILTYGTKTFNFSNLIIPHPQMFKRLFVLNPLKEILGLSKKTKIKNFSEFKERLNAIN
ncbi:MAG: 2-amino-4-hydroxy-6-hydroxymethyldihydropteridine diphosphokinase [Candidatus Gygaella obscura]|nr:2-amino-4-hydroxy-6-hydroxymethyldihydropteridine diphosphokinase [Candidatus Gygaella obscura]